MPLPEPDQAMKDHAWLIKNSKKLYKIICHDCAGEEVISLFQIARKVYPRVAAKMSRDVFKARVKKCLEREGHKINRGVCSFPKRAIFDREELGIDVKATGGIDE